jgi:hypothetical protein
MLTVYIVVGVVAIVIVAIVAAVQINKALKRRRQKRALEADKAAFRSWSGRVLASSDDAWLADEKRSSEKQARWRNYDTAAWDEALAKIDAARKRLRVIDQEEERVELRIKAAPELALIRKMTDKETQRKALSELRDAYSAIWDKPGGPLTKANLAWAKSTLADLTHQRADSLLEFSRGGDAKSFKQLERWVSRWDFQYYHGSEYSYPADWNELVAKLVDEPSTSAFVDIKPSPDTSNVRTLALTALSEQSLVKAAVILAYAESRSNIKHALGKGLFDQLTEMVKELRKT